MRKHVVFVVDASRSMERRDVFEGGERKRRIDAVLDCCFEFIEVRLETTAVHQSHAALCCDSVQQVVGLE